MRSRAIIRKKIEAENARELEELTLHTPWPPCPGCGRQLGEHSRTMQGNHYCAICMKLIIITS